MKRPAGALTREEFEREPIKTYFARNSFGRGELDTVSDLNFRFSDNWFNGKYGYFFHNYFHALAYSLKVKDEVKSKRNNGQVA